MSLPERHKKLLTPEGFDNLFNSEIPRFDTHEDAFDELRRESMVVFDRCIFDDYDSYLQKSNKDIGSVELYEGLLSESSNDLTPPIEDKHKGHVYIFGNLSDGVCKIGYSRSVNKRLEVAQTFYPSQLAVLCLFPNKPMSYENQLHREFKLYRLEGEWFSITGELQKFILENRLS